MQKIITFSLSLLLFLPAALFGATWTVDDDGTGDYTQIQSAINAASSGDTILVRAGNYYGNIRLKSGLKILGQGHDQTVILGDKSANVVSATDVTDSVLEGFGIVHSGLDHSYAGIRISGGSPEIRNNHIYKNINGIRILSGSSAIITNNLIQDNGDSGNGVTDYGIICLSSTPYIANNLIARNQEVGIYIAWEDSDGAQVINNTILDHPYYGIWCYKSDPILKNNIIMDNGYYGITANDAMPDISYNDVWGNWINYHSSNGGIAAPGPGDISADPLFDPDYPMSYVLSAESPCIDAGDPNPIYNDPDETRNDMGVHGGMSASAPPEYSDVLSGFVFTTIGDTPLSEITQSGVSTGLANVSASVARDLGIPAFKDAPFGSKLKVSGMFGSDDTMVSYYQILMAKWDNGTPPALSEFEPITDPLHKIQFIINPDGTVSTPRVFLGPLTYGSLKGLYKRTNTGRWAHPTLKMVWNTSWLEDGTYDLTFKAYNANFQEIIFVPNDLERITLVIDNTPVQAEIHEVSYDNGDPIEECDLINLASQTDNLRFLITAWHPNGFLRRR